MTILIAGGAGFIGSHVCDALLAEGHTVVCIDNFCIGTKSNIAHLLSNKHFVLIEADLNDFEQLQHIFKTTPFDFVFHLAANSDIQASAQNPRIEYQNTYSTTFNLLEGMRLFGVKKLFFASTSAVYGEQEGQAVTEDTPSLQPVSYYGACKLGSEALISAYSAMNDFSSLIFRFPNVIGPRLTHGVIFDFVRRLKINPKCLRILGDGNQCKPYMHVHDLVNGIMTFTKNLTKGITLYNIGVDTQSTVTTIAQIICQEMKLTNTQFEYTGGKGGWKGDVAVFAYNLDKIHKNGWHASMTSDEAVRKTVQEVL